MVGIADLSNSIHLFRPRMTRAGRAEAKLRWLSQPERSCRAVRQEGLTSARWVAGVLEVSVSLVVCKSGVWGANSPDTIPHESFPRVRRTRIADASAYYCMERLSAVARDSVR